MDSARWIKIKELFVAAFDLAGDERSAFLATCDEDLRSDVEQLLNADATAGDFIDEPAMVEIGLACDDESIDVYIGKQIDSYKIVREIGHGGMGTVYLANRADESFDRSVAVKLIKRGMDTNAVLKRFVMERQILAQLQHTNIANLLDGGTTADGLPYFVMEYVEGEPITRFCDSHTFTTDERLDLFRKVCSAMSYAHQNLVVHRDIKPSNILVTEEGTPKLLDFGIAKMLHPDWDLDTHEATATMFRVMTPEYASPEQMRGLAITTTSDVYSLGIVLYELLCGVRPYKVEGRLPEEAAQIVLTEEPPRPSSVVSGRSAVVEGTKGNAGGETVLKSDMQNSRSLRGDLDNIILKALAKEPERRYQSVQEFSEDIRRHLEGLPVTATADSISYRVAKFAIRHRTAVLAGGLVFLTLFAATVVTSWQAIVARRERDKAEQRFNQVRKLSHTVLFDYHDGIAELPGSTPLREKMIRDAIEYLDNLATDSSGDADLQRELAAAYQKVGDVQGNPYVANLGNPNGSLDSYRKGLAILDALPSAEANSPQTLAARAQAYEKLGDIFWVRGESVASQDNYRHALSICEDQKAANELPDGYSIPRLHNRIGQTQEQMRDFDSALGTYQLTLQESQILSSTDPANPKYLRAVGVNYAKIGDVYYQRKNYKAASENFQKSLPILQTLSAAEPNNTTLRRNLGLIDARVALAEMEAGNYSQSVEYNRRSQEIQREIIKADPNNLQIQYDLADALGNLGECYGRMGDLAKAVANFNESNSIFKQVLAKNPTYAQASSHFAVSYATFASVLLKNGRAAQALENYRLAQLILEVEPLKSESTEELAKIYEGIGDALVMVKVSSKNLDEARSMYQASLNALQSLEQTGQLNPENTGKLSEVPQKIAKCSALLEKPSR